MTNASAIRNERRIAIDRTVIAAILALGCLSVTAAVAIVATDVTCPIPRANAQTLELQRTAAMATLRGAGKAPINARSIGPYRLGFTRLKDVEAHELASSGPCTAEVDGALLRCTGARVETVARFAPSGALVGFDRVEYGFLPERAVSQMVDRREQRASWGSATNVWGEPTVAFLAAPLRQTGFAHRFDDVATDVTLTNLGSSGFVLREQWREIPASQAAKPPSLEGGS